MKTSIRQTMLEHRASIQNPMAGELLAVNFIDNISLSEGAIVAGYFPIKSEIDVMPLLQKLIVKGYRIVLPCMNGDNLIFREWDGKEKLVERKFGINEPSEQNEILRPTHIVVPLLAFDEAKHRIGYGGGFYDRTLPRLASIKIGAAYDEQKVPLIPADEHDIKLDFVVTEKAVY